MKQHWVRLIGGIVLLIGMFLLIQRQQPRPVLVPSPSFGASTSSMMDTPSLQDLSWPIDRAKERVTKKPFGLVVSPTSSTVSPERFTGYHTGVDFEAFPEERDQVVEVRSICTGKLLVKRTATGYGGVVVQACTLQNQPVTVVYGHLKFTSIQGNVGDELRRGQLLAVLGKGDSPETGGERKHLHLGIHVGTTVNIRGYVSSAAELTQWMDIRRLFMVQPTP